MFAFFSDSALSRTIFLLFSCYEKTIFEYLKSLQKEVFCLDVFKVKS